MTPPRVQHHPNTSMSPGTIGLESMTLRSPRHSEFIGESSPSVAGAAPAPPPPPPPDLSSRRSSGVSSSATSCASAAAASATAVTSSAGDIDIESETPTSKTMRTPTLHTSPPERRGIRVPCPQFSSSSAFGSVAGSDVGRCFGPYRSRTPSPSIASAMSAVSVGNSNGGGGGGSRGATTTVDASFDSSFGAKAAAAPVVTGIGGGRSGSPSSPPQQQQQQQQQQVSLPSARHVPLMVLTSTISSEDDVNGENEAVDRQDPMQDFDQDDKEEDGGRKSQGSIDPCLEQLLEASVPTNQPTTPSVAAAGAATLAAAERSPQVSSSSVASPSAASPMAAGRGGGFGRFGLSPRKPLPPSMITPGMQHSPMIRSSQVPSSSTRPLLSPRKTAKDSKMADLLFENDDPNSSGVRNRSSPTSSRSKPSALPSSPRQNHEVSDMGAVMDGLLMGFNRGRNLANHSQQFESSNSLSLSMAASSDSRDQMKTDGDEHPFPIKSLSFGGDERKMPARPEVAADCPRSPLSSDQATPVRNVSSHVSGFDFFPQGFKAKSVLTPSKSGGSLQKLLEADQRMREKADREDLENGSLSDSCDDSRGPKDVFFLNSPEDITAENIHAAEVENSAGR